MRNRADLEAGLFFTIIGAATALLSLQYSVGTSTEMGPGYFPLILGVILTLIGLVVTVRSFAGTEFVPAAPVQFKQLITITASIALFAAAVIKLGMLVAVPLTVLVSLFAASGWRWKSSIVLAVFLTVACYFVFVVGLDVRLPVLGVF